MGSGKEINQEGTKLTTRGDVGNHNPAFAVKETKRSVRMDRSQMQVDWMRLGGLLGFAAHYVNELGRYNTGFAVTFI